MGAEIGRRVGGRGSFGTGWGGKIGHAKLHAVRCGMRAGM